MNEQGNFKKRKVSWDNKEIENDVHSKELENNVLENYSFYSIVQQLQLQSIGFEIPIEYTRFMILKLKYKDYISDEEDSSSHNELTINQLVPSPLIMLFWKTHYLQSKEKYKEFCSQLGTYIKYTPLSNSLSKEEKRKRYLNTLSLYSKEFFIKPTTLDFKIWPLDQYASDDEINSFNNKVQKTLKKRKIKKQQLKLQKQIYTNT